MMWRERSARLAEEITHPGSRWWLPVMETPRHVLVPRYFIAGAKGWMAVESGADRKAWSRAPYKDVTLVTRVGPVHADHADPGQTVTGHPTSSSTLPSLVLTMLRHGRHQDGARVLIVGTGTGYSTALACRLLGSRQVTTLDVDPYLGEAAAERLERIGHAPTVVTGDATGPLPGGAGAFDRIVSMVSVPRIPTSWLKALAPGGRLVTNLAGTSLIITADKVPDGGAEGRVEPGGAAFMATRAGPDYPSALDGLFTTARGEGEFVTRSSYPVIDVMASWEVWSMLSLTAPGIEHRTGVGDDGGSMAWMLHADGSWARAHTTRVTGVTTVHQGGPRRLYDLLDKIRWRWVRDGHIPLSGARVTVMPDGETTLSRAPWTLTLEGDDGGRAA